MSLDALRETRQRAPHGWAGTILDDATTLQDEVRVTLDAFRDSRRPHGPMPFLPGSVLPNEGDRCLVMFDESRRPCIVWWGTEDSLPGGGGGGAPSGPAGGVLSGTYPNPGFASDMATQAELDLALAGKQPLDADLTAIAALSTTSFGRAFLALADAAAARTAMALVIGTDVQAYDADLAAIAALATTAFGRSFLTQADAAAARTLLSLTPGTDVQAFDSDLASIAALTTTAYGRSLLTQADAAAARSALGLIIGTDVQAQDAQLAAIAGLTPANDQIIYWTGATSAAMTALTSTARSLLDDTSIGAMRTTLDVPSNAEAILDVIGDAKGDLVGFSAADTPARLAVGSDGQRLEADSSQALGVKWSSAPQIKSLASDATAVVGTAYGNAASGLDIPITSGVAVRFQYFINWLANATTTGARFALNGPAATRLSYVIRYTLTAGTALTLSGVLLSYDATSGNTVGTDSNTGNNLAIIEGILLPSASGTLSLRASAEVASPGSVTVKAGSSVMWW